MKEPSGSTMRLTAITTSTLVFVLGLAFVLVAASGQPVFAQSLKTLGTFTDWKAFTFEEGGHPVCFMHSQPKSTVPAGAKRGEIFVQITHRPAEGSRDVVSIDVGYPLKADSDVTLTIGGENFELFSNADMAWSRPEDDPKIVQAMIRGAQMQVRGESQRGTETRDTYSLSGFTAAYRKIGDACPQ